MKMTNSRLYVYGCAVKKGTQLEFKEHAGLVCLVEIR